jgi:hypothetical protein
VDPAPFPTYIARPKRGKVSSHASKPSNVSSVFDHFRQYPFGASMSDLSPTKFLSLKKKNNKKISGNVRDLWPKIWALP